MQPSDGGGDNGGFSESCWDVGTHADGSCLGVLEGDGCREVTASAL